MPPEAELKALPAMRQHLKIGRWKMSADTATFSDDGRMVTFRGSVRFVTGTGDKIGIEEAFNDPNSFALLEVESGKLLEKGGRYSISKTLGLAPK